MKWSESFSVISDYVTPWTKQFMEFSRPKFSGVGSLSLFQGIVQTQGSNLGLPHCRQSLNQLSHKGNPRILKWVDYPFSSRYSRSRNWTGVSWIAGGFFTNWAIRERQHIKNQRHYFADKGPSSQSYSFFVFLFFFQ